jgi:hypothetical protein
VFYPTNDEEDINKIYECDISIYCINIFLEEYFPKQYIPLYSLLKNIYSYAKENNKIFKIFGPSPVGQYFEDVYCGDVSYIDLTKLYNTSKINICTHPTSNGLWLNDSVMKILGSKGLLLIDQVNDIDKLLTNNLNCVYINKETYIQDIDTILNNYDKYEIIKENGYLLATNYTWNKWVSKVHIEYSRLNFDKDTYKNNYNLDIDHDKLFEYWKSCGINDKQICYHYTPPNSFNNIDYANDNNLNHRKEDIKYLWLHWYCNNKELIYLEKKRSGNLCSDDINTNMETLFTTFNVFTNILNKDKNDALLMLAQIVDENPTIDINKALSLYIELCEL